MTALNPKPRVHQAACKIIIAGSRQIWECTIVIYTMHTARVSTRPSRMHSAKGLRWPVASGGLQYW